MGNATLAKTGEVRPYMIGPELYEIHTDAHLFATRVLVNGNEVKLGNALGNGSVTTNHYDVSGATGYPNKAYLNAFLQPGENEVKVIFDSPLLEQVKGTDGEGAFISDMYAHVIINTGQLTEGSLGTKSYFLDQMIESPDRSAHILKDTLLRRFSTDSLTKEVSVVHTFNIAPEHAVQVPIEECSIEVKDFSNYKGVLSLNGEPVYEITDYGSGTTLTDMKALLVPGENTLEVNVSSIKDDETLSAELQLECQLGSAIESAGLPEAYRRLEFGTFFNRVYRSLVKINFDKPGKYSSAFYYSD